MQGSRQRYCGQVWPSWAAQLYFLGARLGDFEGKLNYREVILKLSWAMLCHVEAILYVRFCSAMLLVCI